MSMRMISCRQAIREALSEEMQRDADVVLLGEDLGCYGGCFQVTNGLYEEFGAEQIIETPVSEEAIVGVAVGAALLGMKPVVEIMYGDFSTLASDPLINHAAKLHFLSQGKQSVPLVYRTPMGGGTGAAAQHTQSLETLFTNIPGLLIVYPSEPADLKGLLKSAIRNPNPVLFFEHKFYEKEGLVPSGEHLVPLGKAAVKRPGTDVSVFTYGRTLFSTLEAAEQLAKQGVSVEVVGLRSLRPLDSDAMRESVIKTGRAVVVHEAPTFGGFAGEIVATIVEDKAAFNALKAPIVRVGGLEMPTPFNKNLEEQLFPSAEKLINAIMKLF